jgi:hypothetical protein
MKISSSNVDGIGRRRGQSATKNICTSILVAVGAFVLVSALLFVLSMNLSSMKDDNNLATYDEDAPPASTGSIRTSQNRRIRNGSSSVEDFPTMWGEIMRGELHLVEIDANGIRTTKDGYNGVKAVFCKLDWDAYKNDPPSLPMFRFLVSKSGCDGRKNQVAVDLAMIVEKTKAYDKSLQVKNKSDVRSMNPTGFVFHESRVGSTLVANSLTAMNPAANRVYSESNPINTALKTDNPQLFRDVVYLMGRTNRVEEENLFFKVSSIGSKKISVMSEAFPDTPWIFVYRDPVQTMMSHLDPAKVDVTKNGRIMAVCTRARRDPPQELHDLVEKQGRRIADLTDQEFCAAHLASLCESALRELNKSNHHGRSVEYDGLIDKLLDDIIPNHFGVLLDGEARQRVLKVSKTYSKAKNRSVDWVEDSEKKEAHSTPEIRGASELFLSKSYSDLKKYSV